MVAELGELRGKYQMAGSVNFVAVGQAVQRRAHSHDQLPIISCAYTIVPRTFMPCAFARPASYLSRVAAPINLENPEYECRAYSHDQLPIIRRSTILKVFERNAVRIRTTNFLFMPDFQP